MINKACEICHRYFPAKFPIFFGIVFFIEYMLNVQDSFAFRKMANELA